MIPYYLKDFGGGGVHLVRGLLCDMVVDTCQATLNMCEGNWEIETVFPKLLVLSVKSVFQCQCN